MTMLRGPGSIPGATQQWETVRSSLSSESRRRAARSSPRNSPRRRSHVLNDSSISELGRCTNAPERRESNSSKRRRSLRAFSARRRSSISAARYMSGIARMLTTIWRARTLSARSGTGNDPRPWVAAQIATSTDASMDRLAPEEPKRSAAHKMNGTMKVSGGTGTPGIGYAPAWGSTKTATREPRSPAVSRTASALFRRGARRIQAGAPVISTTIAGTSVSSVRTLEKNRVRQTNQ